MHERKEIEIRVQKHTSRNWKSQLQWIWNDDSDCFTNFKGFPVTGYANRCAIHYFKSLKLMDFLRHAWRKRNSNKDWKKYFQELKIITSMNLKWRFWLFYKFQGFPCHRICKSMSNTLFQFFKINESIKTCMTEKKLK
jgi:hypothetical protein